MELFQLRRTIRDTMWVDIYKQVSKMGHQMTVLQINHPIRIQVRLMVWLGIKNRIKEYVYDAY